MRRPLLTAAMIARDEERHLPACLASLADVVDEVVLVDTGSVDRTVEIARAHGATVLHHSWSDDFSAPRNLGLDNARGRWILYIDADERLRPVERSWVEALLEDAEEIAFRVHFRLFARATPSLEYRLWRNDSRVRVGANSIRPTVALICCVSDASFRLLRKSILNAGDMRDKGKAIGRISCDRMRSDCGFLLVNGSRVNRAVRRDQIYRDIAALVIGAEHIPAGAVGRQKGRRIHLRCSP